MLSHFPSLPFWGRVGLHQPQIFSRGPYFREFLSALFTDEIASKVADITIDYRRLASVLNTCGERDKKLILGSLVSDDASSTVRNNIAASISKMGCNISKWIIDSSIIFANNKLNGKEERRKSYGQHILLKTKK